MTTAAAHPRRPRRARMALIAAGVVVAAATGFSGSGGLDAHASPSTKYYTALVSPNTADLGVVQQAFSLTLTNCSSQTAGCTKASQQALGSANIQVDSAFSNVSASVSAPGWYVTQPVVGGLVELRNSGSGTTFALAPGQSITVSIVADTPTSTGAYNWNTAVKQSNDFSGTGNDFTISGSQPQVLVGFPDHLVFSAQPSDVQVTTTGGSTYYLCPAPAVQIVAADGTPVTVGSATVTLVADTTFGDPKLGGTTTVGADAGLATFGSSTCGSGVYAQRLGSGYQLAATATWSYGSYRVSLTTPQDSSAFDVVQVLKVCQSNGGCNGSASGAHTNAAVAASSAATSDLLEVAVGIDSLASTTCLPYNQPTGLEVVRVLVDHRDKTVTVTFDKYLVNIAPNNGTPLFTICFAAPWGNWVTASGGAPTFNSVTGEYEGILPNCGVAGLLPDNPCVSSRSKNAGNEVVTVSIPYQDGRADPKLW
jgi:hypothetical protein